MIRLANVSVTYPLGDSECRALQNVDLTIPDGQFVSIIGRSGSGKSTFLRIASGLETPTAGQVFYDDICISNLSSVELSQHRSRKVGFVFQHFMLEPEYDVFFNLELPLMITGVDHKLRKERICQYAEQLGIANKLGAKVKQLSGGERQRVCIARALMNDPPIIFADEPCGDLDGENANVVMQKLGALAAEGRTIVLVTHDMDAAKCADRMIHLRDGMVISDEST